MSNWVKDIAAMHDKYGVNEVIRNLDRDKLEAFLKFRIDFLQEELDEIKKALAEGNLEEYFDGLIDLVYVALGAAYLAGLPFDQGFFRVHQANMKKMRALRTQDSKRGSTYDIVKPPGFVAPTLTDLIRKEKE